MSSLVISGDTSGTVTLAAPAVAGSNTITVQAATGTMSVNTFSTALAYNWNGLTTNTSLDFTGLPSWVKRITVMFQGVSTSGSALVLIQLASSGTVETTGYSGSTQYAASYVAFSSYTGVPIDTASSVAAASVRSGSVVFTLLNSTTNLWAVFGGVSTTTAAALIMPAGTKSTSAALDRIRITTSGSDTFDAGSVNIMYEG